MVCRKTYVGPMRACPQDGTVLVPTGVPSPKDPLLGTVLAYKYEILSVCGKGGMGVVYKARQELIDRIVAIKVLKADLIGDEPSIKRFQLEAKAASRLQHPNVITVHDFGVVDTTGQPYLVMDYIEGESLAAVIQKQGPLNVKRAVPIFVQACSALEHAHRQRVIHRDIKPSNIVLLRVEDKDDFVKVVDFGIAKLAAVPGQESLHLTKTGEVFGSPIYMSPEQCLGGQLDPRSDIYSLGATMYEALTGFPPLLGKTLVDTMSKHINETPASIRTTWPALAVPDGIERVVMKALEKNKDLRYDSMLEMKEALGFEYKRFLAGQEQLVDLVLAQRKAQSQTLTDAAVVPGPKQIDSLKPAVGPFHSSMAMIVAAAAVLLALVAGAVWFSWSQMQTKLENGSGVLYYFREGANGGVAHVFTLPGKNLLKLSFQSFNKKALGGTSDSEGALANGAIWNFNFHRGKDGLILDNAGFEKFDESVRAADELARRYFVELSHKKYKEAYGELSPEMRKKEPYAKFVENNKRVRYREDAAEAPVWATKVTEENQNMVKIMVDLGFFTGDSGKFCLFIVRKAGPRWLIDTAAPIEQDEFEGA